MWKKKLGSVLQHQSAGADNAAGSRNFCHDNFGFFHQATDLSNDSHTASWSYYSLIKLRGL
jgi:hypothetical protein